MKIKARRKPCECGCEEKAKSGRRYIHGHNSWGTGVIKKTSMKRFLISTPGHPRGTKDKYCYVFKSILVAEKALGKYISVKHPIHHIDEDTYNDSNNNLVVCESHSYHGLLHRRKIALQACGHANWRSCYFCHKYDSSKKLIKNGYSSFHRECRKQYMKTYRKERSMTK